MKALRNNLESIEFRDIGVMTDGDTVFDSVNGHLPLGKIVWAVGKSGGGKSVLLKLIAGMQMADRGDILFNGESVSEMSFEEFLPYRLNIGYGFDFGGLISNMTLLQNLILPLIYHNEMSSSEAKDWAIEIFDHFGITELRHRRPAMVVGGVRKLLCQVRAFVMKPQLILLDDPFTGLGMEQSEKLLSWIADFRNVSSEFTLVATSSDMCLMSEIADVTLELNSHEVRGLSNSSGVSEVAS